MPSVLSLSLRLACVAALARIRREHPAQDLITDCDNRCLLACDAPHHRRNARVHGLRVGLPRMRHPAPACSDSGVPFASAHALYGLRPTRRVVAAAPDCDRTDPAPGHVLEQQARSMSPGLLH